MKRRTVMRTEVVVEERIRLNKQQIRKQVKMQRAIAAGINLGIVAVQAIVVVAAAVASYNALVSRVGAPGGEILVFPALAFMFLFGMDVGRNQERKNMEELEDYAEYETVGAESRRA